VRSAIGEPPGRPTAPRRPLIADRASTAASKASPPTASSNRGLPGHWPAYYGRCSF